MYLIDVETYEKIDPDSAPVGFLILGDLVNGKVRARLLRVQKICDRASQKPRGVAPRGRMHADHTREYPSCTC